MRAVYSISKDALLLEDGNFILTYGITATDGESGETLDEFRDVSVNKGLTEKIINTLNTCEVELCHFHEIIIDELNR